MCKQKITREEKHTFKFLRIFTLERVFWFTLVVRGFVIRSGSPNFTFKTCPVVDLMECHL